MKKLGVTEWYLPVNGPAAVRLCRKLGLDGMQITDQGGAMRNYPLLDARIKLLFEEEIDGSDFAIYSLHPLQIAREPGIQADISSPLGQQTLEIFKKSVETCRLYQIPTLMLASFAGSKFHNETELRNTIHTLSEYKKVAEDSGIKIIYEGFSDPETIMRIWEETGGIELCYDVANPLFFGFSTPGEDLSLFATEMLDCIHVKDVTDKRDCTCLLGTGVADVRGSLETLRKKEFEGWYFLENHYNELPLADTGHGLDVLQMDAVFTRKYW